MTTPVPEVTVQEAADAGLPVVAADGSPGEIL